MHFKLSVSKTIYHRPAKQGSSNQLFKERLFLRPNNNIGLTKYFKLSCTYFYQYFSTCRHADTLHKTTTAGLKRHAGSGRDASRSWQGRGLSSFASLWEEVRYLKWLSWLLSDSLCRGYLLEILQIRGRDSLWFSVLPELWEKQQSTLIVGLRLIFPQLWPWRETDRLVSSATHALLPNFNRVSLKSF